MSDENQIIFVSDLPDNVTIWAKCITCPRSAILSELDPWQVISKIKNHLVCKNCGGRNCTISVSKQQGSISEAVLYAGYDAS